MTETKADVLAKMHSSYDEMNTVVEAIPPDRLTEVGVTEEWSARDLLAHLAGYERYVAAAIFGDLTGVPPTNQDFYGRDVAPTEAEEATDDTTNAWVVDHARTLPVEDVLAEFRWAHNRLVEAVEGCEEADLTDPNRFPSMKGKTLLAVLPDQCWGHHGEHLPQLARMRSQDIEQSADERGS